MRATGGEERVVCTQMRDFYLSGCSLADVGDGGDRDADVGGGQGGSLARELVPHPMREIS